jgi:tetratricopeptide (TPR) repeat protein
MVNLDELEDLLRRGEKEKAYKLIKEDRGISAEILINEGVTFGVIGEYDLSISYFELAEKIARNNKIKKEIQKNLAVVYCNRWAGYCELNKHGKAIEDFNKAIELDPNFAVAYYNRGSAYHELKHYEEAVDDYTKAIVLDPNFAGAYYNRGNAYCELNKHEEAIKDYTKAIELNPNFAVAYTNRGITYHELKHYEEAIKDYTKAIELDPNFAVAYTNRGNAYHELNKHEEAIKDYTKAIELDPNFAEAYYNRGNAYCELNKHEEAIEDYTKAIELDPNFAVAYNNRGSAYHELKHYEEAIKDYTKAVELDPNFAWAYNNRGHAYHELNKHEEAIKDYTKAIELDPKYIEAYTNRGNAYLYQSNMKKAIKDYNKAIELNPKGAKAYVNRGITRLQANEDLDKAIEDFKRARDLFEGKDKERMLGIIEWAKARKEMNMKNWDDFRERMNEAREIFEKINDPLSLSFAASIKFSFLDEELDDALNIPDPIKALEELETALKNHPEVEGLIDPERTIFGARVSSFAILSEFISSMRSIDENMDLKMVKAKLAELLEDSKGAEEAFESVDFNKGKTAIVDIQDIICSVKQEIEKIKWTVNKKQKALEILEKYWSRLGPAIKAMNGISTRETENIALRKEIREVKSEVRGGRAETREIISKGFEKSSEEHKEILEKIYVTENILMQKDAINARYRIEFPPPPSPAKIIIDIPIGKLTEKQIEEKAEEIVRKIKSLRGNVKEAFLEAIKHIPVIGNKLLKRLKKMKG